MKAIIFFIVMLVMIVSLVASMFAFANGNPGGALLSLAVLIASLSILNWMNPSHGKNYRSDV